MGGTAGVVMGNTVGSDPIAAARDKGFIAPDTNPRVSGEMYDRHNDKNYDPAKVAHNPMGMYDPDRVKQAKEDLKLPQYQKK